MRPERHHTVNALVDLTSRELDDIAALLLIEQMTTDTPPKSPVNGGLRGKGFANKDLKRLIRTPIAVSATSEYQTRLPSSQKIRKNLMVDFAEPTSPGNSFISPTLAPITTPDTVTPSPARRQGGDVTPLDDYHEFVRVRASRRREEMAKGETHQSESTKTAHAPATDDLVMMGLSPITGRDVVMATTLVLE
ncbi:hypothetical protein J8273_3818 [Carpediemonas membranifera]|uniref:Uncharacterized protein n=1 Tax=Carpediemonas membranifera TaxID=201153 RepID=A0A8J6E2D8_9EUKA|nr:hypothetical protein J8273_3818 [Carpediemonas membranifera]|eukprot:KAG9394568.1 hypothetical protein J8273_3818 [Carpediemonas membranifera]